MVDIETLQQEKRKAALSVLTERFFKKLSDSIIDDVECAYAGVEAPQPSRPY